MLCFEEKDAIREYENVLEDFTQEKEHLTIATSRHLNL